MISLNNDSNFLLIKNFKIAASNDLGDKVYKNNSILIKNKKVTSIGQNLAIPDDCFTLDATNLLVLPGFINCWSYSWQSLFRNIPEMQNAGAHWLYNLAKRVDKMTPADFYTAAKTHYLECLLGGATTVVDCLYLVKDNTVFDQMIRAAKEVGVRLVLVRGSMNVNPSGNPFLLPFIQTTEQIIQESEDLIRAYHDDSEDSMCRIGLGPCSILTGTRELYQETARLARRYKNVGLYSILGEETDEVSFCNSQGKTLTEYMKTSDWFGEDVIFINPVYFTDRDLDFVAETKIKIVDCPRSNARGTGITRLTEMLNKNISVGIGTAGGAGNDRASMQEELLWARYLQGARGLDYLKPHQALKLGSAGGAKAISRPELGTIALGKPADLILYKLDDAIHYAGAVTDPLGSLVGSGHVDVHAAIVNGQIKILNGNHISIDKLKVIEAQNLTALRMDGK